jgi:hypothetical protein
VETLIVSRDVTNRKEVLASLEQSDHWPKLGTWRAV